MFKSKGSREVESLQQQLLQLEEENRLLVQDVQSLQEEIQARIVQGDIIKGDFDEERRDREHMAFELETLRNSYSRVKDDLLLATREITAQRAEQAHAEQQFKSYRESRDIIQSEHKKQIRDLEEKVKSLQNKCFQRDKKLPENVASKNFEKLCQHNDQLQLNLGIVQSEKHSLEREVELLKLSLHEERRKPKAIEEVETEIKEIKKRHEAEKKNLLSQLKSQELLRQTMKIQLDEETYRRNERDEDFDKLLIDLSATNETLSKYQRELDMMRDRLEEVELLNSKLKGDIQSLNLINFKLENELTHYHTLNTDNRRPNQRMEELEKKNNLYKTKYSILVDDYQKLRHLAALNGIQIPPRSGSPHPSHPEPHCSTIDFHGYESQIKSDFYRENELLEGIDDDIHRAARELERTRIDLTDEDDDNPRPLDPNLICPLCGKQFRIGQIQKFRHHVENCTN